MRLAPAARPGTRLGVLEEMPVVVDPVPIVGDAIGGGEVARGIVGAVGVGALAVGAMVMPGTAAAELTPRLPISVESRGMPVRAVPPGVSGDVGVDEAATLPEPEPHMPDMPDVSIMADVAAIDIGLEPVAGATVPSDVPPPS